jgi:hypothetical protein
VPAPPLEEQQSSLTSAPKSSPKAREEISPSHHSGDRRWKHSENSHLRKHNSSTRERLPNHFGTIAAILNQASPPSLRDRWESLQVTVVHNLYSDREGRISFTREDNAIYIDTDSDHHYFQKQNIVSEKGSLIVGDDTRPPKQTHQAVFPGQGTPDTSTSLKPKRKT